MANDQLDQATRHQVLVQLYGENRARLIAREVDGVILEVNRIISGQDLSNMPKAQLDRVLREIDVAVKAKYAEISADEIAQLDLFGQGEYDFSRQMLQANVTGIVIESKVTESFVDSLLQVKPGKQLTIGSALAQFGNNKARDIVRTIADGVLGGSTSQQLVSRVSGLSPMQKTQAGTLVRTLINAVSTQARQELFEDNSDVLMGFEWVSTLDARTSLICISRDGNVYPVNSPTKPPAHFGCRSTMIAKVKPQYAAGIDGQRPAVGPEGAQQVGGQVTYGSWLKKQPAAFQDEVLGPDRGALFRRGGMSVDKFTTRFGRTLTLDELRARDPMAFEKANL